MLGAQRGAESVEDRAVDRGSREITCGCCCWPGSPRDSREKRTEEVRTGPGITAEWVVASKDTGRMFQP